MPEIKIKACIYPELWYASNHLLYMNLYSPLGQIEKTINRN